MKKQILMFGILVLGLTLFAQQVTHETLVVNIEVPVRVFKGNQFIDNLAIDDFEVYENGKLQKLEAVYLIKKKDIERKDEKKEFAPDTNRTFYLFFEITEYSPRIRDAMDYFMQNVLGPEDNLIVVSPMKTYEMSSKALKFKSKEAIVDDLIALLRKDAMIGSMEYRSAFTDLTRITRSLAGAMAIGAEGQDETFDFSEYADMDPNVKLEMLLNMYRNVLARLQQLRYIDEARLLDFAKTLKNKEGQKCVFLFYQREFVPQIEPKILAQTMGEYQGSQSISQDLDNLFYSYRREIGFDVTRVKQAYSDSSASIHFMFFSKPADNIPGIVFQEHSEDIFSAFTQMATATGGMTESSSSPYVLFQKAAGSFENYYLLYYTPVNYRRDGQFKNIKVRVKDTGFNVIHRAGYFAN
ncbi:MAG: hypothetical protein JSW00_10075 [Thermoplasmata archaeon]|nr:MAG: hypothetical protein JSW00_10075 [Thermoplasmata archaeon]